MLGAPVVVGVVEAAGAPLPLARAQAEGMQVPVEAGMVVARLPEHRVPAPVVQLQRLRIG